MNTQKKIERRKGAAARLRAQLDAGTKPVRSTNTNWHSSKRHKTMYATEPLTAGDIKRIEKELATLTGAK